MERRSGNLRFVASEIYMRLERPVSVCMSCSHIKDARATEIDMFLASIRDMKCINLQHSGICSWTRDGSN